ncbi:hypothetical protein GUJ93_ZPchr0008g12439 [Zizania palustris]|uniref:Uncharacterized protein n=1 Tax=Zizania palustris TaxID=103762 RepID=A0A8J5RYK4_ZIZPA|nr:hypothetical protein GUJ93_ZPchr0008g12439 [Zizania palustris]
MVWHQPGRWLGADRYVGSVAARCRSVRQVERRRGAGRGAGGDATRHQLGAELGYNERRQGRQPGQRHASDRDGLPAVEAAVAAGKWLTPRASGERKPE